MPKKVATISVGVQSQQGQWLAENMQQCLISGCTIIDISKGLILTDEETIRIEHRSGDGIEVQQIVMSHPHYVAVVKSCIDNSAANPPGAINLFVRTDPDGGIADVVCEEEAARLNTMFIDIDGYGTVPVFS